MTLKETVLGLVAAAVLALPLPAMAGSVEIGPVSIDLIGAERTSTLTVRNTSEAPMNLQVRTADWSQTDGQDTLTPSTTLVASPPFFTLQPGQAQTVRVVVEGVQNQPTERAWRLIVDELPAAPTGQATGVVVPIRVLAPVFLAPNLTARPKLAWSATQSRAGLMLTARNSGPVHERLSGLTATANGQPVSGSQALFGYVLAGASRSWVLPAGSDAASLALKADGAFGPVEAVAPVTR